MDREGSTVAPGCRMCKERVGAGTRAGIELRIRRECTSQNKNTKALDLIQCCPAAGPESKDRELDDFSGRRSCSVIVVSRLPQIIKSQRMMCRERERERERETERQRERDRQTGTDRDIMQPCAILQVLITESLESKTLLLKQKKWWQVRGKERSLAFSHPQL